jgi:hypothetical protein
MSRFLGYGVNLSPIIPFRESGLEIGFISILFIPLASIVGALVGGYLLSPFFLFAHTKIFRYNGSFNRSKKGALNFFIFYSLYFSRTIKF